MLYLKRFSVLFLSMGLANSAFAQDMSGWSDKTICRLVEQQGKAQYIDEAEFRGLSCISEISKEPSGPKIGINRKNLSVIMDKKTVPLFVASDRNIGRRDAFEIVEFEGYTAAKMSIKWEDKGHVDDWGRFGAMGHAQRLQVGERPFKSEMKDGNEYWYKFSIYMPESTGSYHHTISPFDLKDRRGKKQRDPALTMSITNNLLNFQLKTTGEECRQVRNSNGKLKSFCERPALIINMKNQRDFYDKWLDFVFQINLEPNKGFFRFWINEELVGVYEGDLTPQGKYLGFKFGPYRHHIKSPPQDEVLYYSNIARASNCSDLGVVGCDAMINDQMESGFFGVSEIVRCFKEPDQGKPCPFVCRGNGCNKLSNSQ